MPLRKKSRSRGPAGLVPLSPEAETALQAQLVVVAAACEAGRDLESLKKFITANPQDPLWDQHLMAGLANIGHPTIPPLLADLFGKSPDKVRRKSLKRALHVLKTRGVQVSEELLPREEPDFGKPKPVAVKSLVSPIWGNGDSYLILEGPTEILGGNLLVARLSDVQGLREVHLLSLKRQQQKEFWEHYRQHGLTEWYAVPGPYAVRLLEEASAVNTSEAAARSTYGSLREKILPNWGRPEEAPNLEEVLPAIPADERKRLSEQSRQLAAHPLFQTWMPTLEELTPWLDKLREVQESPLVLSEAQKQGRSEAVLDEAARALYPPEARPLWRRRLLAMAYYLELSGHLMESRLAQAAAADLAESEPSALAGENPFLQSLVQMALRLAWESTQKPQETQSASGLLTLPGAPRRTRR
jgi:hypothetical protein